MNLVRASSLVVVLLVGCKQPPSSWPLEEPPEEFKPLVEKATDAFGALQGVLGPQLNKAIAAGGPQSALWVCAQIAEPLTAEVSKAQKLTVGRTSHKLRNPKNEPRAWAADYVRAHAGRKAADVRGRVFDLGGGKLGVLKPIPTAQLCVACHGPALAPEVKSAVAANYPQDRAQGFAEGDLRGFFWAEVRR